MKSFLNYAKNRFLYNLLRLLIFFGLGLLASQFLLIQEVKALQTEPSSVQFYDNYGSSLSVVSTDFVDNVYYGYLGLTAGSTGGAIGLRLNENIVNGHMYSLTLNVGVPAGGYTSASSKNIIGIGSNLTNAVNSYINANGSTINYTQGGTYEAPHYISFVFTAKVTGSYIVVPYNTINGCLGSCENYFKGYTLNDLGSSDNLTDSEVNSIINNQTYVIQESINNIENNINNTITDNFNNCGDNTITLTPREKGKYISDGYGNLNTNSYYNVSNFYNVKSNTNYTINFNDITGLEYGYLCWYNDTSLVSCSQYRDMSGYSASNFVVTSPSNANKITLTYRVNSNANISGNLCINRIDETNNKLDQAEETRKGILGKIGDLISYINPLSENFFVYKLIELLLDALKSLFIPKDGFFSEWFDEFMAYVELKLGFLATPFTLFIDFVESYLNLSSSTDVIINIPDISVPNFEDNILIHATSFNWSETLRSKDSLNTLWQLYLDFIDVFLILNFIGLCESTYNRIFGGNTANYEYYTVEDSYTYDNNTGEVLSSRRNERTTKRKRGGS